eukprot:scaffold7500_cov127-Isochrysis_galbana.AAC.28
MWFLVFAPPHDDPPSLAGEGDPIPSAQKQAHFPSTWRRGKEGTRGREKEKEPTPRVPREVDQRAGAFPHPFRGRGESCELIQAMWGQLGPTIQLILPQTDTRTWTTL